ncbi:hypothetical protein PJF56_16560 [Roseofilum sp. BLCC_M91]|uniref:Uncharacterized protein n=1 Tax=Roseofilum halophilum BLCC-M91 TaxID=3022259 RepID=A0ABT7BMS6_9CYAN|nr:hypothetical protein [Roseofilum halophilum]MDJ1180476.1 hypothetical protein [Roseofilum halophilum BLCC-M91]
MVTLPFDFTLSDRGDRRRPELVGHNKLIQKTLIRILGLKPRPSRTALWYNSVGRPTRDADVTESLYVTKSGFNPWRIELR